MPIPAINPAQLRLVEYPEPVLRARAKPVDKSDFASPLSRELLHAIAERMLDIMDEERGIGLAAPQVGLSLRLFVLDVPEVASGEDRRSAQDDPPTATTQPLVFINPVLKLEGPVEPSEEGCLSLPDIRGDVLRPPVVVVSALDVDGNPFTLRAAGMLARCIQHENDHLDGVLIIDKLTHASRLKNRKALRELGIS